MKAAVKAKDTDESETQSDDGQAYQPQTGASESYLPVRPFDNAIRKLKLAKNINTAPEVLEILMRDRDKHVSWQAIHTCWRRRMIDYV